MVVEALEAMPEKEALDMKAAGVEGVDFKCHTWEKM